MLLAGDLFALVRRLVRCGLWLFRVAIEDGILVSTKKLHLNGTSVDVGRPINRFIKAELVRCEITVTRPDLEVRLVEIAAHTAVVGRYLHLRVCLLAPFILVNTPNDLVKAGKSYGQVLMASVLVVMILRSRLVSQFVLDHREHFAYREENSASELVLVVNC